MIITHLNNSFLYVQAMKVTLPLFFFFLLFPAFGQTHLAIKKPSGKKKEEFFIGGWLIYKLKNDDKIQRDVIHGFDVEQGEVVFEYISVPLKDIEWVYSQKEHRNTYQTKLIAAGVLFPIIDQFNNMVIAKNDFRWSQGVLITSGGLILTGLSINLLRRKKYRLKNRFRLLFVF